MDRILDLRALVDKTVTSVTGAAVNEEAARMMEEARKTLSAKAQARKLVSRLTSEGQEQGIDPNLVKIAAEFDEDIEEAFGAQAPLSNSSGGGYWDTTSQAEHLEGPKPVVRDFPYRPSSEDSVGYSRTTTSLSTLVPGQTDHFPKPTRAPSGSSPPPVGLLFGDLQTARSCKVSEDFYTVSQEMINYLTVKNSDRPSDYEHAIAQWAEDEWDGLVDPPQSLKPEHYLVCLPRVLSNSEKRMKYTNAVMNLEMARATHSGIPATESFKVAADMNSKILYGSRFDFDAKRQLSIVDSIVANTTAHLEAVRGVMRVAEEQVVSLRGLMLGELKTFNNSIDKLLGSLEQLVSKLEGLKEAKATPAVVAVKAMDSYTPSRTPSEALSYTSSRSGRDSGNEAVYKPGPRQPPKLRLDSPRNY